MHIHDIFSASALFIGLLPLSCGEKRKAPGGAWEKIALPDGELATSDAAWAFKSLWAQGASDVWVAAHGHLEGGSARRRAAAEGGERAGTLGLSNRPASWGSRLGSRLSLHIGRVAFRRC
jgi:hypothetical protein